MMISGEMEMEGELWEGNWVVVSLVHGLVSNGVETILEVRFGLGSYRQKRWEL